VIAGFYAELDENANALLSQIHSAKRASEIRQDQSMARALGYNSKPTLTWFRRHTITRVLERDPWSYCQVECLLFKEADWEHRYQEEIDRLDQAADRLFTHLLEE
jgi:hypothetical protein